MRTKHKNRLLAIFMATVIFGSIATAEASPFIPDWHIVSRIICGFLWFVCGLVVFGEEFKVRN
jgi:hypothetical protein